MTVPQEMGFHGKLPSHGDFLRRRVPGDFLAVWDPWLQSCIHHSRQLLGDSWLQAYLTSPMWRFLLSPGICGEAPCTGLLMPSVDSVGRYFPLTVIRPLPVTTRLLDLPVQQEPWFRELEDLALSALAAEDGSRIADFDQAVRELGTRLVPSVAAAQLLSVPSGPMHLSLADLAEIDTGLRIHLQAQWAAADGFSLWWTQGSERIAPSLILHRGLPPPEAFGALLDGDWRRHGWESRALHAALEPSMPCEHTEYAMEPLRLTSSAISDKGKVRSHNEDAFVNRPDLGLWAVADGVGGLSAGDCASRSVAEALLGVPLSGDLQDRLNAARNRLISVNQTLIRAARHPSDPVVSASTAVVLIAGATECCWLWAGDSRLYRLRDGKIEQLTRDHSPVQEMLDKGELSPEQAHDHPHSNVITRAIGGTDSLEPESRFSDLRSGDRFLLCSDGIHGFITEEQIRAALASPAPEAGTRILMEAVMSTSARDNATAVVVFVH